MTLAESITTTKPVTETSTVRHTPSVSPPTPASTPGLPAASFNASARDGPVPLAVQFTDTSTGIPDEWIWSFGDGDTSTLQNPYHTYTREGSYPVSLTVQNAFGGHTRISQGYITVTPAGEKSVTIEASRGGDVEAGGFIEFTVTEPGAHVKIGGQIRDLAPGERIRVTAEAGGRGKISIARGSVLLFSFERAALAVNGSLISRGTVQDISIPGYSRFISSLRLTIPPGPGEIRVWEEGVMQTPPGPGTGITLTSLRPDPSGVMILDCERDDRTFFQGAVTSPDP